MMPQKGKDARHEGKGVRPWAKGKERGGMRGGSQGEKRMQCHSVMQVIQED
jgi:hypothetical protein